MNNPSTTLDPKTTQFRTLYELARLYEQRRDYENAYTFYQTLATTLKAAQKTTERQNRNLLIKAKRGQRRAWLALYGNIAGFLLLLSLLGIGLYQHVRRQAVYKKIKQSIVLLVRTGAAL